MARTPLLVDSIEQRITITVNADLFDLLNMPAGFSFPPEFVAASRVVCARPVFCVAASASGET